jgi:hypothetical protein
VNDYLGRNETLLVNDLRILRYEYYSSSCVIEEVKKRDFEDDVLGPKFELGAYKVSSSASCAQFYSKRWYWSRNSNSGPTK